MGSSISIPTTDEDIDPTDPVGSLKTVGILVIGFTVLMIAFAFGRDFAQNIQNMLAAALGMDTGDGTTIEVV